MAGGNACRFKVCAIQDMAYANGFSCDAAIFSLLVRDDTPLMIYALFNLEFAEHMSTSMASILLYSARCRRGLAGIFTVGPRLNATSRLIILL
jgi:hypothetical protein